MFVQGGDRRPVAAGLLGGRTTIGEVVPESIPPVADAIARSVLTPLRAYHRFHTVGLEHVPREGAAMVVMHHSLATYDAFLIARDIIERCGRLPVGLGDDNLFKVPGLRRLCRDLGIRPARPETGAEVLAEGGLLMLSPGGTREALRPHTERNRPLWHDRFGFVRLAIRMQVPVLVAGCPAGDRIYKVYDSRITRWAYARTRWPVPIARGIGPTALPRPVRLTGYVGVPLHPPAAPPDDAEAVTRFHRQLTDAMIELLHRR